MGFFSFKCAKSKNPIPAYPYAKLPIEASQVVMVTPDNEKIKGVYDGYGRIDGVDIYDKIAGHLFGKENRDLIFSPIKTITYNGKEVGLINKFNYDDKITAKDILEIEDPKLKKLMVGNTMNGLYDENFDFISMFERAEGLVKIVRQDFYENESYKDLPPSESDPDQGFFYSGAIKTKIRKSVGKSKKVDMPDDSRKAAKKPKGIDLDLGRYEYIGGGSEKFWHIVYDKTNDVYLAKWGRIGNNPGGQATYDEKQASKKIAEKKRKGYVKVDGYEEAVAKAGFLKADLESPIEFDEDTILQINHEGYATIYNGFDGKNYVSTNNVEDFQFRGRDYHDSIDYFNLTQEEIDQVANAFDMELLDNKEIFGEVESLVCEHCGKQDETVSVENNPWNDGEDIQLCDQCYEYTSDNAHERGFHDEDED